jgi:hypothetical protein
MKFTALSIQRPVFAALAFVATCSMITLAVRGSESADSGWNVARPTTVLDVKHVENPQIRIAINHVLQQGRNPLLQSPPNADVVEVAEESPALDEPASKVPTDNPPIVFGSYGTSADGWRPVGLPLGEKSATTDQEGATLRSGHRFRPADSSATGSAATKATVAKGVNSAESKSEPQSKTQVESKTATGTQPKSAATSPPTANSEPAAETTVTDTKTEAKSNESAADSDEPSGRKHSAALVDAPQTPLPPLSQNMKNLRAKVRRVIKSYYTRPLNSRDNDPWELMHGMLAYGVQSQIRQGGPQGKPITLVGWLCYNRPSKGFTLLYLTPENELRAKQGVGLQGHMGQFLAMLAQCQVSPDYPIRVRDQEFTIKDLIEVEKKTCYTKTELTFKLIALMHYLDSDDTWVNDQGQSWDIPRLIREELAQPIRGAACGGTHRLSGLSLAARTRVRRGEPLDGDYLRAAQFVEKYQNYAFQLQNRDGSLSTEWFRGRGDEDDIDRRVKTTGHTLEWLCYSVNDEDVRSTRMFRAANYLATLLATNFDHDWEVGPLGHAIHALRLYDERVFQPYDGQDEVAKQPTRKTARRAASTSRPSSNMY